MKISPVGPLARTRLLLACGVVGPLLFISVFLLEGAKRPGYSAWRHVVSALSLGALGWMQILNFLVCGLLLLGFAAGLRLALRSGKGSTWGPLLFVLFGLGLIGSGLFVADPDLGYPPGAPSSGQAPPTLHGTLHTIATLVTFSSLVAASMVLARRFAGDPGWKGWTFSSRATGLLVVVFLLASAVTAALDEQGLLPGAPVGLLQRLAIISGWSWIALLAFWLLKKRKLPLGSGEPPCRSRAV
jgi:hypothetical membrane protein